MPWPRGAYWAAHATVSLPAANHRAAFEESSNVLRRSTHVRGCSTLPPTCRFAPAGGSHYAQRAGGTVERTALRLPLRCYTLYLPCTAHYTRREWIWLLRCAAARARHCWRGFLSLLVDCGAHNFTAPLHSVLFCWLYCANRSRWRA